MTPDPSAPPFRMSGPGDPRRALLRAGVVLAIVVAWTGCHFETRERPPAYVVENATSQTVEIRYMTNRTGLTPEGLEDLRSVAVVEPGQEARFGALGSDEDTCLDAPLVALAPDGAEVDRLATGTCAERNADDPTWTITG